jgi:hypothetical protein
MHTGELASGALPGWFMMRLAEELGAEESFVVGMGVISKGLVR